MGMTIDKAIPKLQFVRTALNDDMEIAKAYDLAIDTMHKYQKIEQVMDELNGNFYGSYLKDRQALEKIYEVVEDGKETRFS